MSNEARIVVRYPLERGAILLRSDADWERNLEPVAGAPGVGAWEFRLRFDGEFAYYKPVLVDERGTHWAQGENLLALPDRRCTQDVYPHFFGDTACSVCNVHEVASEGAAHEVRVFYPPGYAENTLATYPVLYMQDGQNLFFPSEAYGGQHWKVEETLGVLGSMNLVRRLVVVGVYPRDRMRDYTSPGYEAYGRWFTGALKPWVDANYRSRRDPASTAVLGSSLGGVVSFYLGWQYPDIFGQVGAMSATFGWRDDLLARVAAEPRRKNRIYLDTGWPRDNYEVNRRLRLLLLRRGWVEGRDLLYIAFPEAAHNEGAWAMRAHIPFQFFFGRPQLSAGSALAPPEDRAA
jgi:predicted alpha/beta superfamily hydrolase